MTLTARDKKILMLLIPVVFLGVYWFLLLAPKREEVGKVKTQLTEEQSRRDAAVGRAAQLDQAKRGFADDYATVIRLGKALPTSVDMPSLLVQLDRATRGTGIEFDKIATGTREGAPATPAPSGGQQGSGGNAAAGGQPAQSGPGQAAEAANNAAASSGGSGAGGTTGAAGEGGEGGTSGVAGLDSVPLDLEFTGSFFELADFFHRLKRFVRVANDQVLVRGRLMTIDSFKFTAGQSFPALKAEVKATVYLAPRAQGAVAGASPSGPAPAPAPSATPSSGETVSTPTPTATAVR